MQYLDFDSFQSIITNPKFKDGHWQNGQQRWPYHQAAIAMAKQVNVENPSDVLEIGTRGMPLIKGSKTVDKSKEWRGVKADYQLDITKLPWPFKDKEFKLVIALRVLQHCKEKQRGCFEEMARIADYAIVTLPNKYKNGYQLPVKVLDDWGVGKRLGFSCHDGICETSFWKF